MSSPNPFIAPQSTELASLPDRWSVWRGGVVAVFCGIYLLLLPAIALLTAPKYLLIGMIVIGAALLKMLQDGQSHLRWIMAVGTGIVSITSFITAGHLLAHDAPITAAAFAIIFGAGYLTATYSLARSENLSRFLEYWSYRRAEKRSQRGMATLRRLLK